jgi:hypothetical protein
LTQAVVVGGLFIGVLSALPIINVANCCCLWVMCGGTIAVALTRQDRSGPVGLAEGARIGFRAGIFGALVWVFASVAVDALMAPVQQRFADLMLRNATDMPPAVTGWLDGLGSETTPTRLLLGFLVQVSIATPFAGLGGLLGAAMFGGDVPAARVEP